MTQHSSAEIDPNQPTAMEVPLSDRPLVADEQKTVVASGGGLQNENHLDLPLTATAQEIRDRLFSAPGTDTNTERGLQIAHFEVEKRIGTGGMGAVFRATDKQLSRFVALKILHPSIAADPLLVSRFRNEARAAAQLNHDNIARVFFTGEQDGVHYIAYEYADGKTLKELITERRKLSVEETVNYAIQITLALIHINAAGIVHRDIKPSNIILSTGQRIKVVDLGLARRDTSDSIADLTVAGTTLGTFDYISPEQARDPSSADIRSDIYSLGCTVYHMLTGQPPYPEGTALQKLLDHQGKSPPDPRTLSTDVPQEISFIVRKMMNTDTSQRYQDPGQLLADLISVASQLGLRSVPAEGIVWRRVPIRRVRELSGSLFMTGAVLAVCATAMIMHFVSPNTPPDGASVSEIFASLRPPNAVPPGTVATPTPEMETQSSAAEAVPQLATTGDLPLTTEAATSPNTGVAKNTEAAPVAAPRIIEDRIQLISADGKRTEIFATLGRAWERTKSGDVILLNFNGRFAAPIRSMPAIFDSRSIEIKAAPGKRPVLEFTGDDQSARRGVLFSLQNDVTVSLSGVDLRLRVPDETTSEQWALFECAGTNRVSLRDCSVEVINPKRQSAAIVRMTDSAVELSETGETMFRLSGVSVRGDADLAVVAGQTTLRLEASESAFVLDGSLVNNRGSFDMVRPPGQISVELNHTTCLLSRAAFQMEDSDSLGSPGVPERTLPLLTVTANSNVFAALTPGRPFVLSQGNAYLQELEELFRWHGSFNLYHQFEHFWELKSATFDVDSDLLTYADWTDRWQRISDTQEENGREFTAQLWQQPEVLTEGTRTTLLRQQPTAFLLKRQSFFKDDGNTDYQLNNDGRIPGANLDDLPKFPVENPDKSRESGDPTADPQAVEVSAKISVNPAS